mmetsp:Transcript_6199/g.11077  ORF Transcript_6199/g.11077 Transcript_6199/m.11077 type:complete len:571 (+) Transcript_6199:132-1844(+)
MLQRALTFRCIFTSHRNRSRSNGIIICCRSLTSTAQPLFVARHVVVANDVVASPTHPSIKSAPTSSLMSNTLYTKKCKPSSSSLHTFSSLSHPSSYSDHQPYKREMLSILSSKKLLGIQKALQTQGIWSDDNLMTFRKWLVMEEPMIASDPDETRTRWCRMKKQWNRQAQYQDKDDDGFRSLFLSELKSQREIFIHHATTNTNSSSTINNPPSNSSSQSTTTLPQSFFSVSQQVIRQLAEQCENKSQPSIIFAAWEKIKESGMILNASTLNALLNVASKVYAVKSFQKFDSAGGGSQQDLLEKSSRVLALEEIVMYHDVLCGPTDKSESLVAEAAVKTFKNTQKYQRNSREMTYLQIYLLVLKYHCNMNNVSAALSLLRRMQALGGVVLETWIYCLVLSTIAENGYFRNDALPIEGAVDIGYTHACGPKLFDEIASDMAAEALEITPECATQLQKALLSSASAHSTIAATSISSMEKQLPPTQIPAKHNELVASRVDLDPSTWICPVTETQQHLVSLDPIKKKQLHDDLLELVKDHMSSKAANKLKDFSDWLESRKGQPFSAIVGKGNTS